MKSVYCSLLISSYTQEPGIGYRLLPEYWARGLATEAVSLILNYAFNELALVKIEAQIDPNNISSLKLAKRIGMEFDRNIKPDGYDYADEIWVINREKFT